MQAERPFFSIVIPCYNYGHTLPRALDSALAQRADTFEVIVIDDGSTDDTGTVVKTRQEAGCSHLRYLRQANQGVAAAYKRGFQAAVGKYVVPLDADDELEQDALYLFQSILIGIKRPTQMVIAGHYSIFPDGRRKYRPPPARLPASPEGRFKACLRHKLAPCHGAIAVARDSLLAAVIGNPIPGERDGMAYPQLFAYLECALLHRPTARIYKHGDSLRHSTNINPEEIEEYCASLFTPGVLPTSLLKYEREFRARKYLSYFRTLYRAGKYPAAAQWWSRAARLHLPAALSPSYLRKRIALAGRK